MGFMVIFIHLEGILNVALLLSLLVPCGFSFSVHTLIHNKFPIRLCICIITFKRFYLLLNTLALLRIRSRNSHQWAAENLFGPVL